MPELIAVFLIGLIGSAHCIGMCGGFMLALAQLRSDARRMQTTQALYYLGKTLTYTLLGVTVGAVGGVLGGAFASIQNLMSILLGSFLIVVGLGLVGVLRRLEGIRMGARLSGMSRVMGALLLRGSTMGVIGLGLLNGLLPCGLVYGMLAVAATSGSAVQGGLVMAVFGLSTIPALYLVSVTGFLMRPVWRVRLNFASGILVIALGLVTVVRGTPLMDVAMHHLHSQTAGTSAANPHAHR